jgi:hypothetical protein
LLEALVFLPDRIERTMRELAELAGYLDAA